MRKTVYFIFLIAFVVLAFVSCESDGTADPEQDQAGSIAVSISCSDMTRSGDTINGETDFNENLLTALDIFFYPENMSGDNAVLHDHLDLNDNTQGFHSFKYPLTIEQKEMLFGTGNNGKCKVYIIANGPQAKINALIGRNHACVDSLKQIVLLSDDLGKTEIDPALGGNLVKQPFFVMDGENTVTYNGKSTAVNIKLARSLAKIQLYVHVASKVKEGEITYRPASVGIVGSTDKAIAKVVLNNGLKRGYVNDEAKVFDAGDSDFYPDESLTSDQKARYVRDTPLLPSIVYQDSVYYSHSPFYTYPMTWEQFKAHENDRHTSLMLVVVWTDDGEKSLTTFYTIDINLNSEEGEIYKFKRNTYYKCLLNVRSLGGTTSTEPIELAAECMIMDWNHVRLETSLENVRYLTVQSNSYVMDNENILSIPYATSNECEISSIRVWRQNVTKNIQSADSLVRKTSSLIPPEGHSFDGYNNLGYYVTDANGSTRPYSLKITDKTIIFQHNLDNRTGTDDDSFDYVPFEVEFTVRHKDNPNYSETIRITQHPEISVEAQLNSDYINGNNDNDYRGYVYVNGFNSSLGEGTYFRTSNAQGISYYYDNIYELFSLSTVTGLTGDNKNPNRYVIKTAVAQGESQYIIGDPISSSVNNLPYHKQEWSKRAIYLKEDGSVSSSVRTLTYYHPANESNSENVLSPKFMVASSYGVTRPLSRENAKRRCASYQEEGYPAGRWRLPTPAEVAFCIQLTTKGMIPRLFGRAATESSTTNYWTSTGYVRMRWSNGKEEISYLNSSPTEQTWVRCVYDIWYWGEEMPLKPTTFTSGYNSVTGYRFTWGDMAQ